MEQEEEEEEEEKEVKEWRSKKYIMLDFFIERTKRRSN